MFGESHCTPSTICDELTVVRTQHFFYRVYFKHLPVVMTYYFIRPSQQRVVSREKFLSKCFFFLLLFT